MNVDKIHNMVMKERVASSSHILRKNRKDVIIHDGSPERGWKVSRITF